MIVANEKNQNLDTDKKFQHELNDWIECEWQKEAETLQ